MSKQVEFKKRIVAEYIVPIWIIFVGMAYTLIFVIPKVREVISR